LKLERNLCFVATGITACSLIFAGLAGWQDSGIGAGWRFAGHRQWAYVIAVFYIVGAVGVIWLGWYWMRLAAAIASIATRLKEKSPTGTEISGVKNCRPALIRQLCDAIEQRLGDYSNYVAELEKQVEDLQIQSQLSQIREKNVEAIIYSIRDAIIVIDEFDRLLMANKAAGELFNFNCAASQSKPINAVICDDHTNPGKKQFVDFLRRTKENKGRAARKEIEFLLDETPKTFDCIVSCVHDWDEQVCGAVAVLHDITREKQIQQTKNDFVSHVSHELKTPLASITAYSEMLADGEANDEQTRKEFCMVIQKQAERLNRLIEDILNISRIESGLIKINKEPVSLTILIEEQLQMIKSAANEKNIQIIAQKPIIFDQVNADKDMMSQVIINLLSNAVKYTPPGGSVKVETEVDEIAGLVRVNVTDTGVGIPEDEVEHVFDKFYRVGANKSCAKGTGLGLNLVKQIVEKIHEGRVFVSSKPGKGSTFGFELPLATREAVQVY